MLWPVGVPAGGGVGGVPVGLGGWSGGACDIGGGISSAGFFLRRIRNAAITSAAAAAATMAIVSSQGRLVFVA